MKTIAYFISDVHLGINFRDFNKREEYLFQFFREIEDTASHLFIIGDLFDFWIEYKNAIRPDYFSVLYEFKRLIQHGVKIHYLAGNHDFALGSFLEKTIGINIHQGHLDITLQDKKLHLYHGDGIIKSDWVYRFLNSVLRNPVNQYLYKLLHPDIGIPLASRCSRSSKFRKGRRFSEKKKKAYLKEALKYLESDTEIILMGHTHHAKLYKQKEKFYCNTGEWIRNFNYATLENGIISLFRYLPGKSSERINYQEI